MKHPRPLFSLVLTGLLVCLTARAAVNVTQHHNNPSRDGLFVDPAITRASAANVTRDLNFSGTIVGNVYAQPLYVEGGPNGPVVIAVTQSNNVYALNATTGAIIWQRNVGTAISSGLPCGNISPVGITGTPVVDLASRALFFDAEINGTGHQIFSLNVDTGAINAGWPVTLNTAVAGFDSSVQSERGALGIVGNILYVPYGGRFGDCGSYKGRLVGVQISNPAIMPTNWATGTTRAGVWAPGGVASDGTNTYVTTGNGSGTTWAGNEAVIRLQPGPIFSGATADYWAPTNWQTLDAGDTDLSGSGPILVDVPGATPSALVVAIGKDRNAYLLDRNNLGGVTAPLAQSVVSSGTVINAAATYRTSLGTYVVLRPVSGTLTAFKINAASPPTIATGWSASSSGRSSPFVTTTDGTNNSIVWAFGVGASQRLFGYNGDTGAVIYAGGGANDVISGTRAFNTGIAARGRIYVAGDNKVYAFNVPSVPPVPTGAVSRQTHGLAGDFDIPLPLTGTPGVECRSGGATNDHTIVVTFSAPVTVTGDIQAQVNAGAVGSGGTSNGGAVTVSGNSVTIPLTNLPNAQTTNVTLFGVTDGIGYGNVVVPISCVLGDVTGNGSVNASDVGAVKAVAGSDTTAKNFRSDVTANGTINASDVGLVKSSTGTGLP